jgi:hypothetical protein
MRRMSSDKPVHANNVPTPTTSDYSRGQVAPEQVDRRAGERRRQGEQSGGSEAANRFQAEAELKAKAESQPVAGTESRPYVDEPGKQLRSRTKTQDPSDAAVQPRSDTEKTRGQAGPGLRNQ